MKSAILASVLLSSLAIAAPVDKRAANTVWHTEVVTVTAVTTYPPGAVGSPQQPSPVVPVAAVPTTSSSTTLATIPAAVTAAAASSTKPASQSASITSAVTTASAVAAGGAAGTGSIYQAVPTVTAVGNLPPPVPPTVGNSFQGDGTLFNGEGDFGSCGLGPLVDTDLFAAVPVGMIGHYRSVNKGVGMPESSWCGVTVEVSYQGKTALAPIKSTCMGCKPGDIDMSPALFGYLTNGLTEGRFPFSWKVVAKSPYF